MVFKISFNCFYCSHFLLIFIIRSGQALNRFREHRRFSSLARLIFPLCENETVTLIPKLRATRQREDSASSPRTLRFIRGKSICRAAFLRGKYCLRVVSSPRLVRTLVRFYVPVNARLLSAFRTHTLLFTINNESLTTTNVPAIFRRCTNVASAIFEQGKFW